MIQGDKSGTIKCAGHTVCTLDRRDTYGGLVGKPEGKRPLGRPRGRLENKIKMDVVNEVVNLRVP
jgi:hypothetical protein